MEAILSKRLTITIRNKMKRLLGFLSFLVFTQSFAQDSTSAEVEEPWTFRSAEKIIKISPLNLMSFVPTVGLDLEVQLKERRSIQVGAAIIPTFMQVLTLEEFNGYESMGGYHLRGEGRFYTPSFPKFYYAAGFYFRHLIIRDDVPIGMEGVTDEFGQSTFAYFKNTPMVFNRFNTNLDIKWGVQLRSNEKLAFDFYCGLSLRNVWVQSSSSIPEGGMVPEQQGSWRLVDNHTMFYPIPIAGIKIGLVR